MRLQKIKRILSLSYRRTTMSLVAKKSNDAFAKAHAIEGLSEPSIHRIVEQTPSYTLAKARQFLEFQQRINRELLQHRIIVDNCYTAWFSQGQQNEAQIKAFVVQFSVFSNQFLLAQLSKTLNADSLESMRASKEILANEIGVVFNVSDRDQSANDDCDPALVSTVGTVEGGAFRFRAAHFEWLLRMAEKLGLGFNDIGKRRKGIDSTLFYCDELIHLYGGENYAVSQAASYAVENWAAAGFWGELIQGFEQYNHHAESQLPLAFFTWHDKIEAQHALHTQEELEELYFTREIDEAHFINVGNEMLNGVATFWDGLEMQRKTLQ